MASLPLHHSCSVVLESLTPSIWAGAAHISTSMVNHLLLPSSCCPLLLFPQSTANKPSKCCCCFSSSPCCSCVLLLPSSTHFSSILHRFTSFLDWPCNDHLLCHDASHVIEMFFFGLHQHRPVCLFDGLSLPSWIGRRINVLTAPTS